MATGSGINDTQGAVLVTGASSGIGLETAVHLASHGFKVYATMRDLSRRAELDAECARRNARLEVLQLDITDPGSIQATVARVLDEAGALYGLVNNAGIVLQGFFEDLTNQEIRDLFETNFYGTLALTRAVLPHMRQARRGRIIIVTSVSGKIGSLALSAYSSSKFALEGFGEALAREVEPLGLHVSLVAPGIVKTGIWDPARGVASGAQDPESPYYPWLQQFQRMSLDLIAKARVSREDVARTIHLALTARKPRLHYVVGRRARLLFVARQLLPGELFERLYRAAVLRRVTRQASIFRQG
jgi:NAD(P)-dependent dehydrogenase (short-subunit alcohol dehydrogenase family)